jgi:hypothetical protein
MAEWSKAVDLSPAWISTTEMCVGSNPTRVRVLFLPFCFFFLPFGRRCVEYLFGWGGGCGGLAMADVDVGTCG